MHTNESGEKRASCWDVMVNACVNLGFMKSWPTLLDKLGKKGRVGFCMGLFYRHAWLCQMQG